MRMKHRWTGALLVAAALSLGACAPAQSGSDGSAEPDPTAAPASTGAEAAPPTAEPSPSESATSAPTPAVDYEY
jgi:hypothetical protein